MSQFFIPTTAGNLPPAVPTSFVTNSGVATPVANVLNVLGDDSTINNVNGITTTGSGNTATVLLTNRIVGTGTTTDGTTPQTLYTFPLGATPGTYLFFTKVVAYNVTDSLSAGYSSFRVNRTTGAAASNIGATTAFATEEGTMSGVDVVNSVAANNATLQATGLPGKTINFFAVTDYIFIS